MHVTNEQQRCAIKFARKLVESHVNCNLGPNDRLWQIARQLNVSQINSGASRSDGFVKQLADGSYAVYYSGNLSIARRRYTVAHELAHLVLDQFVPHVSSKNSLVQRGSVSSVLERSVDRIAAELIMPRELVCNSLEYECREEMLARGELNKYRVVRRVQEILGVSLSAMIFRLLELDQIIAMVVTQDFSPQSGMTTRRVVRYSEEIDKSCIGLLGPINQISPSYESGCYNREGQSHLLVKTPYGKRQLRCDSIIRNIKRHGNREYSYWTIGWTWNNRFILQHDDSIQISDH